MMEIKTIRKLLDDGEFYGMHVTCPDCRNIEDDQYTCTTCWGVGGNVTTPVRDIVSDIVNEIESLRAKLSEANKGLNAVLDLINESHGVAGQSNMVGLGQTPASLIEQINNVVIWEGNHWETFKPGKCFGPELQFAIDWSQNHPNETIGFIKYAIGGTSMEYWQPGGLLYLNLMNDYIMAGSLPVKAILWDQGEADCTSQYWADYYQTRTESLISSLQSLTGAPFIFGETISKQYTFWDIVHSSQVNISSWPNVTMIDTSDLTLWGDNLHFDTNSQLELGHRFYMAANPNN